jgi:hypothetical protein
MADIHLERYRKLMLVTHAEPLLVRHLRQPAPLCLAIRSRHYQFALAEDE